MFIKKFGHISLFAESWRQRQKARFSQRLIQINRLSWNRRFGLVSRAYFSWCYMIVFKTSSVSNLIADLSRVDSDHPQKLLSTVSDINEIVMNVSVIASARQFPWYQKPIQNALHNFVNSIVPTFYTVQGCVLWVGTLRSYIASHLP